MMKAYSCWVRNHAPDVVGLVFASTQARAERIFQRDHGDEFDIADVLSVRATEYDDERDAEQMVFNNDGLSKSFYSEDW